MKTALLFILTLLVNGLSIPFCCAQLSDALMLKVENGRYSDQTAIRFLEEATNDFDSEYDAYKLRNRGLTPNLSSKLNDINYSIDAVQGGGKLIDLTVPLNIEVAFNGEYVLTAEEIGKFDISCTITLIDNVLRTEFDLRANATYTFLSFVGDPIDRFAVKFKSTATSSKPNSSNNQFVNVPIATTEASGITTQEVKIFDSEGKILLKVNETQAPVDIHISDLGGNTLVNKTFSNLSQWEFPVCQNKIYIVNLTVDGVLHTQKVFVQ